MAKASAENWGGAVPLAHRGLSAVEALQIAAVVLGMIAAFLALTYSIPTMGSSPPASSSPRVMFDQ